MTNKHLIRGGCCAKDRAHGTKMRLFIRSYHSSMTPVRFRSTLLWIAFLVVSGIVFVLLIPQKRQLPQQYTQTQEKLAPEQDDSASERDYRECILRGLDIEKVDASWNGATTLINKCMASHDMHRKFPLMSLRNSDETKYLLNVTPAINANEECNVVTLGIGKDIAAEEQLAKLISKNCHFHGADPGEADNKQLYTKIGKYYPFAVAATSGVQKASLYVNGTYKPYNIPHVDLITFLKKRANISVVDYLLMDAESAEFDMAPMFLPGGAIDKSGITVCQWNCEFHAGNHETHKKFVDFMRENIISGWYVPLKFEFVGHIRTTLINDHNELCKKRYLQFLPK